MSDILQKFDVFSEISEELKQNIKLFHVFDDWEKSVLFVTNEDKVFGFGFNNYGKCGLGYGCIVTPTEIPELSGKQIKQFFNGNVSVLALNEGNQVFAWGWNHHGQLARPTTRICTVFKPNIISRLFDIIDIRCGLCHCLALDSNGNVYGWGSNKYGQVQSSAEHQNCSIVIEPVQLVSLPKIKLIHCFENQSFVLTIDGLVYSWGQNTNNCLGHSSYENILEPKLIDGINNVINVGSRKCGNPSRHITYFLTIEGIIYFCGHIGENSKNIQKTPKVLKTDLKFNSLATIFSDIKKYSHILVQSEETVYYIKSKRVIKTDYKTISDYCLIEKQITFKTTEISFNDKFEELSQLGSGGFGRVIKVKNRINQTTFAVKIIPIESFEQESLNKMNKEVELLSKCNDKYVAKYFYSWIEKKQFFIQMELCSDNLKKIIEKKKLCFGRQEVESMTDTEYFISGHLAKEILECVQYLHDLNPPIIHRDLKPANILVNYEQSNGKFLKLCDFGLATFDNQFQTISHTDNVGTLKYVSPEVLNGTGGRAHYTTKADIFSLGFILCDLFNFDLNSSGLNVQNNRELSGKWRQLEKHITDMLNTIYRQRPNCSDLLREFEFWAIKELTAIHKSSQKYKENVNQMRNFENLFFYNFFVEKSIF